MKRFSFRPYLLLATTLIGLLVLSAGLSEWLQQKTIASLDPGWWLFDWGSKQSWRVKVEKLSIENQLLHNELDRLKGILKQESLLEKEKNSFSDEELQVLLEPLTRLHRFEISSLLELQTQALPACVIFRPFATWNHSLWVGVGTRDNEKLGREIIAHNSPVVIGTALVGVIDAVGRTRSRVRLLSDPSLVPAVRATRRVGDSTYFLAKGELCGCRKLQWRGSQFLFRGEGFNCDFADEQSPARDLRTGKSLEASALFPTLPLLQKGDLLLTTGMDGVFPPGLAVAEVISIDILKEGATSYDLWAKPVVNPTSGHRTLFILPPQSSD